MPPLRLLVTGPPGVGKTTLLVNVHKALPPGAKVTGFLSNEIRGEDGYRYAFEMASLDGTRRGMLASARGPNTGKMVSKYHVQVDDFERLSFPLLDAAIAGDGAAGPRVFIFDEIGKMEMFSTGFVDRVRNLLTSTDPGLHVLGTVAVAGGGFIAASKRLPGVEVIEISQATRNNLTRDITTKFAAILGSGDVPMAPADVEPTAADPGTAAGKPSRSVDDTPRARFDRPPPGKFSAIYQSSPEANFASLNAGDTKLFVGGGAINRAFQDALVACRQNPRWKYEELHRVLLSSAARAPGRLQWVRSDAVEPWALEDSIAFCGLIPADPRVAAMQPVGLVSISVFPEGRRPCGNDLNIAMVYVVGPNCKRSRVTKSEFLETMQVVGGAIASAVAQYNEEAAAGPAAEGSQPAASVRRLDPADGKERTWEEAEARYRGKYKPAEIREYWQSTCRPVASSGPVALPRIDILRVSLISGGDYKHPEASKVDVASALIKGLLSDGPPQFLLDFAFDEDCFRTAWRALGLPGGD